MLSLINLLCFNIYTSATYSEQNVNVNLHHLQGCRRKLLFPQSLPRVQDWTKRHSVPLRKWRRDTERATPTPQHDSSKGASLRVLPEVPALQGDDQPLRWNCFHYHRNTRQGILHLLVWSADRKDYEMLKCSKPTLNKIGHQSY